MESVPEFHARNPPGGRGEAGGLPPIPVRMAAKQIHFPSIFHPFSIHFFKSIFRVFPTELADGSAIV